MKLSRKLTLIATVILGVNLAFPLFVLAQSVAPSYLFQFNGSQFRDFRNSIGIGVDAAGNVYVADIADNKIEKYSSTDGGTTYNFASSFGSAGFGDGQLNNPAGIAFDSTGNIYVVDGLNNRIQKFDSTGTYLSKFGSFGAGDGQFRNPTGIVIDSTGNIYITDSNNNRVEKFDSTGTYVSQFATNVVPGEGTAAYPSALTLDAAGNIYVADLDYQWIEKFVTTDGGITYHYDSEFGDGHLGNPVGLAADSAGNIYVTNAGGFNISKFDSSETFQTQIGSFGSSNGRFYLPTGITQDASGNFFVLDSGNDRVQKFDPSFNYLAQFSSALSNSHFNFPDGITLDATKNVYVVDTANNRVEKFDPNGNYLSAFGDAGTGNGQFNNPSGIAIDSTGNIYVTDVLNDRVQKFNSSGVFQSQFGSTGTAEGQFSDPYGITFDSTGNIYVTDVQNNRVQKFSPSGTFISTFGWGVSDGIDQFEICTAPSSCQAGLQGTGDGQFTDPRGIAIDSTGNIYVVDNTNNRVEKFNSSGTFVSQFGTTGSANGQLNDPFWIRIDSAGNSYISDVGNNRVDIFDPSGNYSTQFGGAGTGNGQFQSPGGIALDPTGNIYVTDITNNRVQVFAPGSALANGNASAQETIQPGVLELSAVPANFGFPAVNITNFQTYNTVYANGQSSAEKLTAKDERFAGGFEVQATATDYCPAPNANPPPNTSPCDGQPTLPVSDLGVSTQVPNSTDSYTQTTQLANQYSNTEGTLVPGSQQFGAVISQTLPFNFTMFGRTSNKIYICTTGVIFQAADLISMPTSAFDSECNGGELTPGNYNQILPYYINNSQGVGDHLTTIAAFPYPIKNGVYFQQVSDSEVHIRYQGNVSGIDNPAGSIEFTVFLFKDGRIEYHYGPITDTFSYPDIGIIKDPGPSPTLILANQFPFGSVIRPTGISNAQIRFTPVSTIFNDVSKPGTPPVFAVTNSDSTAGDPANFTMFTEDNSNPGNSVPVSIVDGAACTSQGRLGNYTVYPSFLLQVPPTTTSNTYQNTITFTILDNTVADGSSFCTSGILPLPPGPSP